MTDSASTLHKRGEYTAGSLPPFVADTDEARLRWGLEHYPHAEAVPSDRDHQWIVAYVLGLFGSRAFWNLKPKARFAHYEDVPLLLPKWLVLRSRNLKLDCAQQVAEKLPHLRRLRQEAGRPEVKLQQSFPNPLDLSYFVVRYLLVVYYSVFARAARQQVWAIPEADRPDVCLNFETPAVLYILNLFRKRRRLQRVVARALAGLIARFLSRLPETVQVILHLCFGDLDKKPLFEPDSLAAQVMFLNFLQQALAKRGRSMPEAHMPVSYGEAAASTDPAFYADLARLHEAIQVIAGIASYGHPLTVQVEALRLFETALSHGGAIPRGASKTATGCGCGRCQTGAQVEEAAQRTRETAAS